MRTQSVAKRFTDYILKEVAEGRYIIGGRLPPERELAQTLGISRTIVRSEIAALAARGLLKIVPRRGTFINDYWRHGSVELLNMLLMRAEVMEKNLFVGIMECRRLLETHFAYLAAKNRTEEGLKRLKKLIEKAEHLDDLDEIAENNFLFHQEIAYATGNAMYPLILKSMEGTYINLVREFFLSNADRSLVLASHKGLCLAIEMRHAEEAQKIMENILTYGERIRCVW
ncbi:MAG: FCD domain-containing protein [Clostridia bacterium]